MAEVRVDGLGSDDDNPTLEEKIYKALRREGGNDEVIDLCKEVEDGAMHYCPAQKSTVLHLACYFKNWELAVKLLGNLSDQNLLDKLLSNTNDLGDTVLHDACTSNDGADVVGKMLEYRPELLKVRNKLGETCVFRATSYGKMRIFKILAGKVDGLLRNHSPTDRDRIFRDLFQRDDGHTILHTAILRRKLDLAVEIAEKYPEIHKFKTEGNNKTHNRPMTALQLLACSPAAFVIESHKIGRVKKFLYYHYCVSVDEKGDKEEAAGCFIPILKEVRKLKKSHNDARKLSELLVKTDFSWKNLEVIEHPNSSTGAPKEETIISSRSSSNENRDFENASGDTNSEAAASPMIIAVRKECIETLNEALKKYSQDDYEREILEIDEAPLLMAARTGCFQIVKDTMSKHPEAVYYVNSYKENLLHVAIKSRNMDIFEYVLENDKMFARGLLRALDKDENCILHMVGCPRKQHLDTKMKSPMMQLSEDLNLLKRLEDKCPSYLQYHRNKDLKTAGELFAERNEKLRVEAKEWMTKTSEQSIVVIILLATIAFTAAYTIPGGPDDKTGYPILLPHRLFIVFTVTDVLSLGIALTSMVVFLTIITSSYQFHDFRKSLPGRLFLGLTLLFLSMAIMMVSFAATIILTVNEKRQWTKIALYVVSFFPVSLFMLYYISVYMKLAKDGLKELGSKFLKYIPRTKKKYSLPCTTSQTSKSV